MKFLSSCHLFLLILKSKMKFHISLIFSLLLINSTFSQYWGPATPFPGATGHFQDCTNDAYSFVTSMCEYNNELYVGGNFKFIGGIVAQGIARWNGNTWNSVGQGNFIQSCVTDIIVYNGDLYFTGEKLYKWDGTNITEFTYYDNNSQITMPVYGVDLHVYNNELYISSPNGLLKFNGTSFIEVNVNNQLSVNCIEDFNNDLYIGTDNGLFKYVLGNWVDCNGVTSTTPSISDLEPYNGYLYVCGSFNSIGGIATTNIAKYSGSNWSSLPLVNGYAVGASSLKNMNNQLFVAGTSPVVLPGTVSCPLLKYNGNQWTQISSNAFYGGLCSIYFQNDLYVGGRFTVISYINNSAINVNCLAKLEGSLELKEDISSLFEAFPNPTNGIFHVSFYNDDIKNVHYSITDILGTKVIESNAHSQFDLNLENFPSGIYLLTLSTGTLQKTVKIIKN